MPEWLTSSEVKQRLNLSHDSLVNIVLEGELKAYAPGEGNKPLVIPKQSWNQSEECRAAYVMNNEQFGIDLWEYRNKRTQENDSDVFCIIEQCAYNNLAPLDLSSYCNDHEPAPPIKRTCIDEFKILFLTDKDLFYDEYGNVNERFQSLVSITTNETAHPAIRRLAISEILSELKFQKTDIEAHDTETTPAPQTEPQAENYFKQNNKHWAIKYKDEVGDHIDHVDGLLYIAHLLEKPGEDISDQILYQLAKGVTLKDAIDANEMIERNLSKGFKPQPIGTDKERKICQEKYLELQGKLETASLEEQDEINEKMDKLVPYLNMKKRNFADPNDKKAQSNVKKRIDLAYDKLKEENMPELATYLKDTIKTGDYGRRYIGPVTWKVKINK